MDNFLQKDRGTINMCRSVWSPCTVSEIALVHCADIALLGMLTDIPINPDNLLSG